MIPYVCATQGPLLDQIRTRPDIDAEGAARFLELIPPDRWPTRVGTDTEGCLEMIWDTNRPAFANICLTDGRVVCCYAKDATGHELFVDDPANEVAVCRLFHMLMGFPPSTHTHQPA